MAVKTRKGGKKGGAKKSGAAKQAAGNGRVESSSKRRTAADVDALVPGFVKHLTGGGTMKALKAEHGFSSDVPIREALARAGYDSKGNELDLEPITAKGAKLATALVAEREAGTPWYILTLRTDKPESELRKIVEEAGGPSGRVYREPKPKAAKKASAKKGGKKGGRKASRKSSATDPSA